MFTASSTVLPGRLEQGWLRNQGHDCEAELSIILPGKQQGRRDARVEREQNIYSKVMKVSPVPAIQWVRIFQFGIGSEGQVTQVTGIYLLNFVLTDSTFS